MTEIASLEALEELFARQRAVREFKPDPVDDALIARLIAAATRAPSAKNVQILRFVVVCDADLRRRISELFEEQATGPASWANVPVLIFIVSEDPFGSSESGVAALAGSVYPGIQNLLLAARAAGLGTVLTTSRGKARQAELKAVLTIPENVTIHAVIPVGWPAQMPGKNRRKPVSEVAFRERYGQAW